jgi:hypothetical protein
MPVEKLNYLKSKNYESQQNLQASYLREIIHSYGIATTYMRKDLDFYESPSGTMANYTYGESTTSTYWLSAEMPVYFFSETDSFTLNGFGIENNASHQIYFMVDDFYEQFRDQIGTVTSGEFPNIPLYAEISGGSGYLSGNLSSNEFDAMTSGYIDFMGTTGEVSGTYMRNITAKYKAVNQLIYHPRYYKYDERYISGEAYGTFSGMVDASGNGSLVGNASSELLYITGPAENNGPHWNIAPQVGDFFRIDFQADNLPGYIGENHEEYEITQISDRNLLDNETNPLIGTYVWKCDIVRRDPSYENTITEQTEEEHTVDKLDQNIWHENISNTIFDYSTTDIDNHDPVNSDDVYGGY